VCSRRTTWNGWEKDFSAQNIYHENKRRQANEQWAAVSCIDRPRGYSPPHGRTHAAQIFYCSLHRFAAEFFTNLKEPDLLNQWGSSLLPGDKCHAISSQVYSLWVCGYRRIFVRLVFRNVPEKHAQRNNFSRSILCRMAHHASTRGNTIVPCAFELKGYACNAVLTRSRGMDDRRYSTADGA